MHEPCTRVLVYRNARFGGTHSSGGIKEALVMATSFFCNRRRKSIHCLARAWRCVELGAKESEAWRVVRGTWLFLRSGDVTVTGHDSLWA
ncbi:hypothetical protein E2C01_040449 [Portunus trituberculatus]|uniref:Uncharacterized protein n=1 Tax=Portunus trituberculatus TaxID=210409 RepID=A0A5B7FNT7_PORTR|nr:hypothetical protein [Portunus trituberculatus]